MNTVRVTSVNPKLPS